ncbi:MAG: di-heme-cytochrome C peroxidase [Methylococcaceae bacterium]|jgi:hypothetical protein
MSKNKKPTTYQWPNIAKLIILPLAFLLSAQNLSAVEKPIFLDQGKNWTNTLRESYYSQDQGSQIMPLTWFKALKQPNGQLFMADHLSRYGYLANESSPTPGLPVGFTTNKNNVGMTCAACHTRQIDVNGQFYRIDGGPAIVDFQSFASDLRDTVAYTLDNAAAFEAFAESVLGKADADKQTQLKQDLQAWFLPYRTLMDRALPKDAPWGPARLDAVGMIFNRLTGLDIGSSDTHIIESNIHLADAPVRYPFLWNAPIQDKTQWPGFADNGNSILALSRNFGEVIGVFGHFQPQKDDWRILGYDYVKVNSGNFDGLKHLEKLIKQIAPPKWPWPVDKQLAEQGKALFASTSKTEEGGCLACHGIEKGATRSFHKTWATPLCDVGTDAHQFELFTWKVDTGVLAGAQIPFFEKPLQAKDEAAFNVLGMAVIGTLLQHESTLVVALESAAKREAEKLKSRFGIEQQWKAFENIRNMQHKLVGPENSDLQGAFHLLTSDWKTQSSATTTPTTPTCKSDFKTTEPKQAYESRVMQGIWATAPYLHNGSVPTLADLLKPVAERPSAFKVGSAYDISKVGLAVDQSQFDYTLKTTDCSARNSGNSRCGHEFGTKLSEQEKAALLEYMKIL